MVTATSGAIDALAEFAVTATAKDRQARLALHLADAVMARLAGAATSEGRALYRFYDRMDAGRLGRVAADSAVTRLTEIDDIHRPTCVTVSALTAPVALVLCDQGCSRDRLLDSLFVGQETALRVASALGGARLLTRGLWPSFLVAPIGAAATMGRLLGLPFAHMRQALALAVAQVPRVPGRFASTRPARWMLFGEAVRQGCVAALGAADGMQGDPGLLDAAWLHAVGGDLADASRLDAVEVLSDALSIKPHASAKQALAAIHGLQQLLADKLVSPEHIEAIELHVPTAYAPMLDREPPRSSRLASLVSAPWQLALAALHPHLLDDVARESWPTDPRLADFAGRVRVLADSALDALYPAAYPARLVIHAAGDRHEILVTESPGDPALPFDAPQMIDKARRMLKDATGLTTVQMALRLPADGSAMCVLLAELRGGARGAAAAPAP